MHLTYFQRSARAQKLIYFGRRFEEILFRGVAHLTTRLHEPEYVVRMSSLGWRAHHFSRGIFASGNGCGFPLPSLDHRRSKNLSK